MGNMSAELKAKVWVNGKLITIEELKQQFQQFTIAGTSSTRRVIEVLAATKKPLTRQEIAEEVKLTAGHTRTLLKKLVTDGSVLEIKMEGSNSNFFLLTEKGVKSLPPEEN
jgi:predicted ArsR family transcriptional regulator